MTRISAGLLLYRQSATGLEVLLVHPGGPFWAKKDAGAWSIPKGEPEPGEDLAAAARRELAEETGCTVTGELLPLGSLRQPSGKLVHAWAVRADFDPEHLVSGTFTMEWPPPLRTRAIVPGGRPSVLVPARRGAHAIAARAGGVPGSAGAQARGVSSAG